MARCGFSLLCRGSLSAPLFRVGIHPAPLTVPEGISSYPKEQNMSLVSVIIPAFNAANYIRGSIDSVLAQTFKAFEIIIVDDGSTDDTAQVVAPYLSDPRIRYFRQENRGLPGARNAGANVAPVSRNFSHSA